MQLHPHVPIIDSQRVMQLVVLRRHRLSLIIRLPHLRKPPPGLPEGTARRGLYAITTTITTRTITTTINNSKAHRLFKAQYLDKLSLLLAVQSDKLSLLCPCALPQLLDHICPNAPPAPAQRWCIYQNIAKILVTQYYCTIVYVTHAADVQANE